MSKPPFTSTTGTGKPANPKSAGANPHKQAAKNYALQSTKQEGKRETEAKALLKAARLLQELQNEWDNKTQKKIEETLKFNRQIWVLFYENAITLNEASNANPADAKQPKFMSKNVINLASFVFKRSIEILAAPEPEKLNILININREIAAGLMAKPVEQK